MSSLVSSNVAQQEAALKRIEEERDRLISEVLTLRQAMPTRKACEELVKYVESTPEPFAENNDFSRENANPWTQPKPTSVCCNVA
jgi:hypothetical protein